MLRDKILVAPSQKKGPPKCIGHKGPSLEPPMAKRPRFVKLVARAVLFSLMAAACGFLLFYPLSPSNHIHFRELTGLQGHRGAAFCAFTRACSSEDDALHQGGTLEGAGDATAPQQGLRLIVLQEPPPEELKLKEEIILGVKEPIAEPVSSSTAPPPVVEPVSSSTAPIAEPIAKPVAEPVSSSTAPPPIAKSVSSSTAPIAEPIAKPVAEPVSSSTAPPPIAKLVSSKSPVAEPIAKPVAEPVSSSTAPPPIAEPVSSSTAPIAEPIAKTVAEPVSSSTAPPPIAEPVSSSTVPIAEPIAKPVAEPVFSSTAPPPIAEHVSSSTAPIAEPIVKPVAEPVSSSTANPPIAEPVSSSTANPPIAEPVSSSAASITAPIVKPVTGPVSSSTAPPPIAEPVSSSTAPPPSIPGSTVEEAQIVLSNRTCRSPAIDGYTKIDTACIAQSPTNKWFQAYYGAGGKQGDLLVHYDQAASYDGIVVAWGLLNKKNTVEDCAAHCLQHMPGDIPGFFQHLPCNVFVYCPLEECWEPDALPSTKGDCWLKFAEAPAKPEVNLRGDLTGAVKEKHPEAPPRVQWVSGALLPPGVQLTNGTWSPRVNW